MGRSSLLTSRSLPTATITSTCNREGVGTATSRTSSPRKKVALLLILLARAPEESAPLVLALLDHGQQDAPLLALAHWCRAWSAATRAGGSTAAPRLLAATCAVRTAVALRIRLARAAIAGWPRRGRPCAATYRSSRHATVGARLSRGPTIPPMAVQGYRNSYGYNCVHSYSECRNPYRYRMM